MKNGSTLDNTDKLYPIYRLNNKKKMIQKVAFGFLFVSFTFLISGCGSVGRTPIIDGSPESKRKYSQEHDGLDTESNINPMLVPNAVPKKEPKSRYGNPRSYEVFGKLYRVMDSAIGYSEVGNASWYGKKFHGERTSSGESYNMYAMTAAHKTLPLPTYVKVTNLKNKRFVIVKVNDRGPFHEGRIIDLSYSAASQLDIVKTGTGKVRVETVIASQKAKPILYKNKRRKAEKNYDQKKPAFIQVGAFSNVNNAKRLQRILRQEFDYPVNIEFVKSEGILYKRVLIGPIHDLLVADDILQKVLSEHSSAARLLEH